MSLENLLETGQLKEHPVNAAEIQKLLAAARSSLRDAQVEQISLELRFEAAYNSILRLQEEVSTWLTENHGELI